MLLLIFLHGSVFRYLSSAVSCYCNPASMVNFI